RPADPNRTSFRARAGFLQNPARAFALQRRLLHRPSAVIVARMPVAARKAAAVRVGGSLMHAHTRAASVLFAAVSLCSAGRCGSTATAKQATAQTWPQRAVKFILPLGAGSGADIGARLIADKLAAKWGQPVVVENRPGGDGFVAINAFVSAHDDH